MPLDLNKIADTIETRGVVNSNHRLVAYGAYGIWMISLIAVEWAIFAESGFSWRIVLIGAMLILAAQQVYSFYLKPSEQEKLVSLKKSLKFSQYSAVIWVAALYPWPHADLNILIIAVLVFQLSVFVSLARFHIKEAERSLICTSALILCVSLISPSVATTAMTASSIAYIAVLWIRARQNRKSYQSLVNHGLAQEASIKSLQRSQELLYEESRTDQMTRIGNRRAFFDFCEHADTSASGIYSVVAVLDLDDFKQINDMHGHDAGDAVIYETANRLSGSLSPNGRIFRLGGDEFVLVYQDEAQFKFNWLKGIVEQALDKNLKYKSKFIDLRWSMGIATVSVSTPDFRAALTRADKALYKAKGVKQNHAHIFSEEDQIELSTEAILMAHTETVLSDGALEMHGQPIYDINGEQKELFGVESLLRIKAPNGDPIRPDIFVEKANLARHTSDLTLWSLRKSVRLLEHAPEDALLTFNLSPEQFVDEHLCEVMAEALAPSQFDPRRLVIELSEKTLLSDINLTQKSLETLKKFGVKIALDDFGSENTGFSTLIDFDVDIIKTDPKLLMSALTNKRSAIMFQKIMELCKALNTVCIAEGVETLREFEFAKRAGCRFFQGYYFGRPAFKPEYDITAETRTMLDPVTSKSGWI